MIPTFNYGPVRYPLSVALLSHNRLDELERNIPPLIEHCRGLGYELIIADNASCEEVRSFLRRTVPRHPDIVMIFHDSDRWAAGGRNSAFSLAHGEFVLSIDDDVRVAYEVLRDLPGALRKKSPFLGVLAIRVRHAITGEEQNYAGDLEVAVRCHHGAAFAIPRSVLGRIGGFDDLCDFGSEEFDLCIRAHAAGYQILYDPAIIVGHNSFRRPGTQGFDRKLRWVFSASRTMHKYLPLYTAQLMSTRYFLIMTTEEIKRMKVNSLRSLLWAHLTGCYTGLRHRSLVPAATVAYYSHPDLLPADGNRPCARAIIKRYGARLLGLEKRLE